MVPSVRPALSSHNKLRASFQRPVTVMRKSFSDDLETLVSGQPEYHCPSKTLFFFLSNVLQSI